MVINFDNKLKKITVIEDKEQCRGKWDAAVYASTRQGLSNRRYYKKNYGDIMSCTNIPITVEQVMKVPYRKYQTVTVFRTRKRKTSQPVSVSLKPGEARR